jgi:hypothetical protein
MTRFVQVCACGICDVSTFECALDDPVGSRVAARRAGWRTCIVNGKVVLVCPQCTSEPVPGQREGTR